jgi:NAD(P)-dependent dehydrogenase (short-subunit alcohol dehydrogenase family)
MQNDPITDGPVVEFDQRTRGFSESEFQNCLKVLRALCQRPHLATAPDPLCAEVVSQAAELVRARAAQQKQEARRRDQELRQATGLRLGRPAPGEPGAPSPADSDYFRRQSLELSKPRRCYICRERYTRLHFFYDSLCPACGDFNYGKRSQGADLSGLVALATGARVKIGFQVALKLLRCGATVIATTRFPHDAARRYARESDCHAWSGRLQIHGIDLRHLPAVEGFTDTLQAHHERLDIIVNNAAQTVRRPPAFYQHLLDGEAAGPATLPGPAQQLLAPRVVSGGQTGSLTPAALTQIPLVEGDERHDPELFPPGRYDADGQQLDRRPRNSWTLQLEEVSTCELVEVHAVNCLAPFILLSRLEPLLLRGLGTGKYVVNVSAAEGQFRRSKAGAHPHTNMAKASLNMLTRTCAGPLAKKGIFLNSVDTGCVSIELPAPTAERLGEEGIQPPLDAIDGAARVCDPIFTGLKTGQNVSGKFLKDYHEVAW